MKDWYDFNEAYSGVFVKVLLAARQTTLNLCKQPAKICYSKKKY